MPTQLPPPASGTAIELLAGGTDQSFYQSSFLVASGNITITQPNPAASPSTNRRQRRHQELPLRLKTAFAKWGRCIGRLLTRGPRTRSISPITTAGTKARRPTHAEVYASLESDHGLPIWPERRPRNVDVEGGTVPGDVGTLSATGGFRKIFNIWADAEAIRKADLSTHRYTPPERDIATDKEILLPSEPITQGTTTETQYKDGKISSFEFKMMAPRGAVCVSTTPADLVEVKNRRRFRKFVIENASLICKYARARMKDDSEELHDDESLYVVTSCIKSDSWAVAAFKEPSSPPHDVLRLQQAAGPSPGYVWTSRGTALARSSLNSTGKNQTLFIQGFRLCASRTLGLRLGRMYRKLRSTGEAE